jgi:ketosteroid isomerase-like protein
MRSVFVGYYSVPVKVCLKPGNLSMRNKLLFVASLLALSIAIADDAQDVRCSEIAFSLSVEEKDVTAFASFIDDDARFVGSSVSRGPVEVTEAWSVFFADDGPLIKWRPQIIEVLEDSTLALSRGPYRLTTRDAQGNATDSWGTFNSIWRKQPDGLWEVVFDAGNASATPPPEEIRALLEQAPGCH